MKAMIIIGITLLALGGTLGTAQELKKDGHSGMRRMMKDMMQEPRSSEGSLDMMHGMDGMMGMMKMMEQCSGMMKSGHDHSDKAKDTKQK